MDDDVERALRGLLAALDGDEADGANGTNGTNGTNGDANASGDGHGPTDPRRLSRVDAYHRLNEVEKRADDALWPDRLEGAGSVRKRRLVGPPPANETARAPQAEGNEVVVPAYLFTPAGAGDEERPGLVLPHGGVHSNCSTRYAVVVRELLEQGYRVVAPEYRGSTGYGREHYELVDYGGREVADTHAARDWLVAHEPVDPDRVGVLGWSHGGLHTILNAVEYPDSYAAAYASVPVSDLVARMGYKTDAYRGLYEADYHVGETGAENPEEYRRRSPAWRVADLEVPLRVHGTTNDEDVNVLEVERLVEALRAHDRAFESRIREDAPGGHVFELLDTAVAEESRREAYDFLAERLDPPAPPVGVERVVD
jgi:dipeptidyl aminopeptidase/acylaminoacyl peptidase